MKKLFLKSLAIGLMALLPALVSAQDCVTVGTGTSAGYDAPFNNYYKNAWTQTIYSASDINHDAGQILSIAYNCTAGASLSSEINIYMGLTTKTASSSATNWVPASDLTLVYSNSSYTFTTTTGWKDFTLSTPFAYDGKSNIVVCVSRKSTSYNNSLKFAYTSSNYSTLYRRNDSDASYANHPGTNTGSTSSARPNIKFCFPEPTCYPPTNVQQVGEATQTSASFTWAASGEGETQYQYVCVPKGTTPDWSSATLTSDLSATVNSGIFAGKQYDFCVRSYCGSDDQSSPVKVTFQTACGLNATFPWSEDFESYTPNTDFSAPCWRNQHIVSSATGVFKVSSGMGGNTTTILQLPDMQVGNQTMLVLPGMNIPTANTYAFYIDVLRNATDKPTEGIRVFVNTTDSLGGTPTELGFISRTFSETDGNKVKAESASGWYTYEFPIPTTGECYIILRGESQYGSSTFMDNFAVKLIPNCKKPTDLTKGAIDAHNATLTWTKAKATDSQWRLEYKLSTASWDDASVKDTLCNLTSCTLPNLAERTSYDVRVYTHCGESEESEASDEVSFTTPCDAVGLPYFNGFEDDAAGSEPSCFTINKDGGSYPTVSSGSSTYVKSGSKYLNFGGYSGTNNTSYTVLPLVNEDVNKLQMEFYIKGYSSTAANNDKFEVGVMTSPTATGTYVAVSAQFQANDEYQICEVDFSEYAGSGKYIAIKRIPVYSGSYHSYKYYGSYLDDITVSLIPNCKKPKDLELEALTSSSATISWTKGKDDDTQWKVQYRRSDASSWTTVDGVVTTNPYTLSGLEASTNYFVRVCTFCDPEESLYSDSISILTNCAAKATYQTNFDSETMSAMPSCWNVLNMTTTSDDPSAKVSNYFQSSSLTGRVLMFTSSTTKVGYAIMPELTDALNTYQITMSYRYTSYGGYGLMDLGYMTEGGTFVSLKQLTYSSSLTTIEDFVLNVPDEDASTARLAIRVGTGTTNSRQMYVDDINIQKIPTCKKISDVAASEPTAHGAKIVWTTAGADSTEIKVTAYSAADASAAAVFDTIVENTNKTAGQTNYAVIYSLDIEDNTQYKVWARGYCSSSDQGAWAKNYGTFKTLCDPFVASDLAMTDFETSSALDCWTKDGSITSSTGEYYAGSKAYKLAKNNYLITPQLIAQMDTLQVSFYAKGSGNNGAQMDTLYVGVCEGTVATFDTIASLILTNGFQFYAVSLKEYTGAGKYIALLGQGVNTNYICACVDNLAITKAPDCGLPYGVGIKSQDYAESTISWSGEANTYFYGVSTEPVAPANWDTYTGWIQSGEISAKEVVVTTNAYRQYYFYVKAICSATSSSWNAEGFAFKPACGRPMAMPFSENFNASTNIPDCWSTIAPTSTSYSYIKVNSGIGVSSSNALEFQYKNYGSPVAIVLPVLDADIADCKLTFQLASSQYTSPSIYLDVVEDPSEITTSSLSTRTGITYFSQYGSFGEKFFDFSTYEGTLTGKYIILYQKFTSSSKAYVDNISIVKKLPRPSDVVITPSLNGASVTFKQKEPTGNWKWSIDGGVTTTAITDSAFQISGLDAANRYTLQIWHVGATEVSAPYEEKFETLCEATIITDGAEYEETFDGTELPTCWKRVSNASNFVTISQEALYFQKDGIAFLPEFEFVDTTIQYCEMTFTQKSSYHPYKVIAVQDPSEITLANVNEKAFVVATMTTGDRFNEIYLDNVPEGYNYLGFYIPTDESYISIDTLVVRVATLRVPTNLNTTEITDSSAVVTFEQVGKDPDGSGWNYQYAKDADFTNPVEKYIDDMDAPYSFTIKNLDEKGTYYVRMTQAGDPVDNHWSESLTFTTECGALKFSPYVYTFDNMTVDAAPNCFTVGKGGSASNPTVTKVSDNDTALALNGYSYSLSSYSYFALPVADAAQDMRLLTVKFKAKAGDASYKKLYVGVVENFTSISSFTGEKLFNLTSDYVDYEVELDTYTGNGKYIVFFTKGGEGNYVSYKQYVDNITIDVATCMSPSPKVSNIKAHEVTLANGLTTGANWAWRFKDATAETTVVGTITSTTVTGLEADSAYTIQVQARCAENDSSKWKDVSFRTMCDPLQGSDTILFENFDSGKYSTCWPMMENNKPTFLSSCTYQGSAYAVNVCNASAAAPKVMILQGITFTPGHYQISFYGRMWTTSAGTMKLALAQTAPTTVAEVNDLSVVYSANVNTASYGDPYMYEFDQATTADMNVVLFMNGSGDICIDNVLVYKTPCDKAESATSSDVTANSAVISIANEDPDWNVVVKNGNNVAFTQSNIQTASVTATGLNASTSYIAIITMNCGYATSDPDTINFTTTAAPETWDLLRGNLSADQVGTACQEKNITKVRGGVLYGVNKGTTASIEFVEKELPIAAGEPLLFQADGTNDGKIEVVYGSSTATAPRCDEGKTGVRGFVGNLSSATSNVDIAEGNILVSGGMLRLAGTGCYMGPGRAYIKAEELPVESITSAPARARRLVLTQNGTAVATGADEVMMNNVDGVVKVVRDGQLLIIKGGKMYNAQGQVLR